MLNADMLWLFLRQIHAMLVMTTISNSLLGYYSTVVHLEEVTGWGFIVGFPPVTVLLVPLSNLRKGKTEEKKKNLELFDHMLKFEVQCPPFSFCSKNLKNKWRIS